MQARATDKALLYLSCSEYSSSKRPMGTQLKQTSQLFISPESQPCSAAWKFLRKWLCLHLLENKRSTGRLNMQMTLQNSLPWLLNPQPAAAFGPWLPRIKENKHERNWQAVPASGFLPENQAPQQDCKCSVANLAWTRALQPFPLASK